MAHAGREVFSIPSADVGGDIRRKLAPRVRGLKVA
jgi:hypothetical protein